MIGKEIADAIAPIVMWVAIVGGVVGLIVLIRHWIRRGAKKEAEGEAAIDGKKTEDEARKAIQTAAEDTYHRWLARRRRNSELSHDEDR